MDLYAWNRSMYELMKPGELPDKLVRVINIVPKRYGLTVRNVNMKDFDNELEIVKKIYNEAWEKNWGFVPLTEPEFDHIVGELKPILDENIVFVVEKDGEPVGFSLSLPDVNEILNKIRPGPGVIRSYIAATRMIRGRRKVNRFRVFALGVLQEFRGKGVDALMYYETAKAAVANNYEWGEASWVLENNDEMKESMDKSVVFTDKAPAAVGPYSQAIKVGHFVYTAGQVAIDPAISKLIEGDISTQTKQVIQNLQSILQAAGTDLSKVVKTTVFLQDMAHFASMNEVYSKHFGDDPPARTTVAVAGLPLGALVEIEAVALLE
jgi:reactive intermediate/imine deaminase